MTRVAVALAVVIALAAGVWMLWPDGERTPSTTTTLPIAASSSTTSTPAGTTTTADDHIVETVEEAEAILRDYWLGWYLGFHHRDAALIREAVLTEEQVEAAASRFGTLEFIREPEPDDFQFEGTEILRSDSSCLAIWAEFSPKFLSIEGTTSGVNVFRWSSGDWKSISYWKYRNDLWDHDCDVSVP